ncbi:hypothetical protein NicSoilC5_06290 [Arthrobacter sp. NicSoilC5]|nr:hypothetical protein NicSoilC5_06290 [Arthrobacter sp. NicSoilC5]
MDQVGALDIRHNAQVHTQGLHRGIGPAQILGNLVGGHGCSVVVSIAGSTESANLQVNMLTKHPAQFGYMHPGATVDLRRELFSHNVYSHKTQGSRSRITVLV